MVISQWGHNGRVHGHDKDFWNLADTGTPQPLAKFTPNQVLLETSWPVDVQHLGHLPIGA